jgi:RNA polymerase sigma factor (TIGR02999 family)
MLGSTIAREVRDNGTGSVTDTGRPGDESSAADDPTRSALFVELYGELKSLRREIRRRGGSLTLGAETLLHETWVKLSQRRGLAFPDRGRFLAYAARAMRGLVIDYARRRQAQKRGGAFAITALPTDVAAPADSRELERLSDAIDALGELDPALAELVDLKYFCGYSFAEIAALRGISERTALREWEKARIVLHRLIRE